MPKLPNEPYPGLRPFLDHEAPLLMGRAHQVREIIKRLETARFVAVVGGSGCGKSSLIRAGVVPKLRGFGIPSEGDYWVPVVYSPGTTRPLENTTAEEQRRSDGESPVTRLSWKLAQVLKPAATSELDASRRHEIATVFRQGAGFARLVDAYSDDLRAVGPTGADARFLFVIDQFEELFHPNNYGSSDVIATIEAVISHFYNPHERCFVVLTMRSEHLADCAGYLELPDAINKSLYLVRRLNEQEIREAIVGPAKYYLRLKQRAEEAPAQLPADVAFDESVIERLLQDVASIANDADHLPLLQHLLARIWYSSCLREGTSSGGVPAAVRWQDLERAVDPGSAGAPEWLRAANQVNTLRSSLKNWADHTYDQRTPEEQAQIDAVLRRLAFRDPNSGFYFQQRVNVDDPSLQAGVPQPRQHLRKLLERGFLDTVNYLFWDNENSERVTLKVSHEAFIRGWDRFRKLIDDEAERFEEFVSLLKNCAAWKAEGSPRFLLESSQLARVEAAKLEEVFRVKDERRSWFQHLLEYHDGERLAKVEPELDEFLAKSRQQIDEKENERREAASREERAKEEALKATAESQRNWARLKWAGVVTLVLAFVLGFISFIQIPVMESVIQFNAARNRTAMQMRGPDSDYDQRQLKVLLESARLVKDIRGRSVFALVDALESIPPFRGYKQYLETSSSEPWVSGPLRAILTTRAWDATPPHDASKPSVAAMQSQHPCEESNSSEAPKPVKIIGTLVRASDDPSHGIFISDVDTREGGELRFHRVALENDGCRLFPFFYAVPKRYDPAVVVDANLKFLAIAMWEPTRPDYVSLFALQRGINSKETLQPMTSITDPIRGPEAAALIRKEIKAGGRERVMSVKTWPTRAGAVVSVGDNYYRLFANDAVPQAKNSEEWAPLAAPVHGSGCKTHEDQLKSAPQTVAPLIFQHGSICLEIGPQQGPPGGPDAAFGSDIGSQLWVLNAHSAFQSMQQDRPGETVPLANFPIGVLSSSDNTRWWTGKSGTQWEGWIALEQRDKRLLVAPWATSALVALGCEVLRRPDKDAERLCPTTRN